jgi:hypothetical protein
MTDKKQLIQLIRESADVLKPLLGKLLPVAEGDDPKRVFIEPEPYALAWSSKLSEMATMLEYQECEVSDKQMHHIRASLGVYGGNTTLADLSFNSAAYPEESRAVNKGLDERIKFLRNVFGEGPRPYEPWGAEVRAKKG